jgi:hypothetical protein
MSKQIKYKRYERIGRGTSEKGEMGCFGRKRYLMKLGRTFFFLCIRKDGMWEETRRKGATCFVV